MNRTVITAIAVLIFFSAQSQNVFFNPSSQQVEPLEVFTTTIEISDVENLGAFELEVYYNSDYISANSVTLGDFIGSTGRTVFPIENNIDNESGIISYAVSTIGPNPPGPNGNGILLIIEWFSSINTTKDITIELLLQNVQATEPDGTIIPLETTNAQVTILMPELINTMINNMDICPETVHIPINISNLEEITSFHLELDYNASELSYLSYLNVHPQLSELSITNTGNTLIIQYASDAVTIENGTLLELEMLALPNLNQVLSHLQWDEENCYYSTAEGNVNAIYSSGIITIHPIPYLELPVGDTQVDIFETPISNYITTGQNIENYHWFIFPTLAGNITWDSEIATVEWNNSFLGFAYVKVQGTNDCGSTTSDSLEIVVSNSVGLNNDLTEYRNRIISIYPNPINSKAKITYMATADSQTIFKFYNIFGALVKSTTAINTLAGSHDLKFNHLGLSAGVYIISMEIDGNSIDAQRIVVQ